MLADHLIALNSLASFQVIFEVAIVRMLSTFMNMDGLGLYTKDWPELN
jgi:hypothetical protein